MRHKKLKKKETRLEHDGKVLNKSQQAKMKELWGNKEDEVWGQI